MFCLVSPLLGCTGSSILPCEFSILLAVCRVSHCLCTLSMASTPLPPVWCKHSRHRESPSHRACPSVRHQAQGWEATCLVAPSGTKESPFPLGFLLTDTAMNICSAHRTSSGQAGDLGSGARHSAGVAFKPVGGPVKTGPTVQDVTW